MRRALTVSMSLLLLAGGCSGGPDPVLLGAVYPTGGAQGMGGVDEYRGVELAAELINDRGGVRGRPVELLLRQADSPDAAPRAVREVVHEGADIVLGSYGSTVSDPAAATASELGAVFWETGAVGEIGEGVAAGERFFRIVARGESLGEAGVRFVRDALLPLIGEDEAELRYGVTYVDDAYGRSVGLGALAALEEAGLPVAGTFPYRLTDADYDRIVADIGDAGTDVLFVASYLDDAIAMRRAMLEQELPLVASVGTSSSYCMHAFGAALGRDAVGLYASDKPDGEVLDDARLDPAAGEALRWARKTYRERFDHEMTSAALSGFASTWALLRHVLPSARGLAADAVAEAAVRTKLPVGSLPNGSGLDLAPAGHPEAGANLRATSVIWEWVAPQTRAIVWPPELATSDIRPLPIS